MIQDGDLMSGSWYPRGSVGIRCVIHMIKSALTRVKRLGVQNWDVLISRILTVVFATASGCRARGLKFLQGYNQDESLQYSDVHITLGLTATEPSKLSLLDVQQLCLTFWFEKGFKQNLG